LSGGRRPLRATFWLLEAPDSLAEQSRRNPDGYGIGTFEEDGSAVISKRPAAAYEDELFALEAKERESPTFVAHVRYASTGGLSVENTHPFEQRSSASPPDSSSMSPRPILCGSRTSTPAPQLPSECRRGRPEADRQAGGRGSPTQ
jgi:hypothetical protein